MKSFLLLACLCLLTAFAAAEVTITQSPAGWELTNGHVRMELIRSAGTVRLKSLRREGGVEW